MINGTPRTAVILGAFLLVLSSCASSGGPGAAEPPDTFDRAGEAVDRLANTYERESLPGFMKGVGADYDPGYINLENRVREEFDRFDAFDLDVVVDRVSVDSSGTVAFADTHWTKRRVSGRTGKEGTLSGRTTLIFRIMPDGGLVLKGMKGDPVFGSP
jgi:hypothetical protein